MIKEIAEALTKLFWWILTTGNPDRYNCPCCGYKTLHEQVRGSKDICPVCYWKDDYFQIADPDRVGTNKVTLRQAQKNFIKFGASDKAYVKKVQNPFQRYSKDKKWKPLRSKS